MTTTPDAQWLLAHARPAPRYTSYPPASAWKPLGDDSFAHALREIYEPASVYVHVPFCKEQCWFCGCNTVVSARQSAGDAYLDRLAVQLQRLPLATPRVDVTRIHIGGGTPTWLTPEQLHRLFELIDTRFMPIDGAELSLEADPDVTTDAHLDVLARRGVTRLSFGVQSFDSKVLAAIGRPQDGARVAALVRGARARGINKINLDFVYGLPFQDARSLASTIDRAAALGADRLAVYGYAHVPWVKTHQRRIAGDTLPSPLDRAAMVLDIQRRLVDAGYVAIGMDHYAHVHDELAVAQREGSLHRNFMGYTTQPDVELIGVGVSAISEIDGTFAQQEPMLGRWNRAVDDGGLGVARGWVLSDEDRLRREVIEDLMCNFAVDWNEIAHRFGIEPETHFAAELVRLAELASEGMVELDPRGMRICDAARPLVRTVASVFDAYAASIPQHSAAI